jgi:CBS domain-containing protein
MQVSELMATDVVTVGRNDDLRLVDDIMSERHIRHIPVVWHAVADHTGLEMLRQSESYRPARTSNPRRMWGWKTPGQSP